MRRLTIADWLPLFFVGLAGASPAWAAPLVYVYGQADFTASNGGLLSTAADFNRDGKLDFVALNYGTNSVSIMLGQPDGSFADNGTSYPVGDEPVGAAVGDFNGDGFLDLAVANQVCASSEPCPPASVSILLGNGDGTFQPRVDYETAPDAVAVTIGDFNGDQKLDLAVATATSRISSDRDGKVSILLGNGDGTFGAHADFPAGRGVVALATGEFTVPGVLDLVVDNHPSISSRTVSLLQGNGDGTFGEPMNLTVGGDPVALATGDFNRDGKLDLAVATNDRGGTISILLGNGGGTFQPPADYAAGFGPHRMIAADLNDDGKLDLVVSIVTGIPTNGAISVLLGTGDGAFLPHAEYLVGAFGPLAVGDFNGDAKVDVAVGNTGNTVSVVLGNGDGSLAHPTNYSSGSQPAAVAAGDFNLDGNLDLAVANSASRTVSIFLGNGDGTFAGRSDFAVGTNPLAIAVGDFNGDFYPDLAVVDGDDDTVSVLLSAGDGTLLPRLTFATGGVPRGVTIHDFNGDGKWDLAVTNSSAGTVSILLGRGDGTFEPRVDYAAGRGAAGIAADDFDGDGRIDLAVANSGTGITFRDEGLVSVLLGNGDGTFQAHRDFSTANVSPQSVTLGDFNLDGWLDLAVTTNRDQFGSIAIFIGNGDGTFRMTSTYSAGRFARQIVAGDFNGDGILDLAQAEFGSNLMTLLAGRGDGTFRSQGRYGVGFGPLGIAAGDFNGDSALDAAVVNVGNDSISIFLSGVPSAPLSDLGH